MDRSKVQRQDGILLTQGTKGGTSLPTYEYPIQRVLEEAQQSLDELRTSSRYPIDTLLLDFFRKGFRATTLSSVEAASLELTLILKLHIGLLTTFLDEMSCNSASHMLLSQFPQPSLHTQSSDLSIKNAEAQEIFGSTLAIYRTILKGAEHFPQFPDFRQFLEFDLAQIVQSFRYTQLVSTYPSVTNPVELSTYGPHTMGQVAAGMIDLMATSQVHHEELGLIRTVLALGQRLIRISNVLATFQRELTEGDMTNELTSLAVEHNRWELPTLADKIGLGHKPVYKHLRRRLLDEQMHLFGNLERFIPRIQTFDVSEYMTGLRSFDHLHERMRFVL